MAVPVGGADSAFRRAGDLRSCGAVWVALQGPHYRTGNRSQGNRPQAPDVSNDRVGVYTSCMSENETVYEKPTIIVISDFVCPWCYIGLSEVEKLSKEYDIDVEFAPFFLRPDTPPDGMTHTRITAADATNAITVPIAISTACSADR